MGSRRSIVQEFSKTSEDILLEVEELENANNITEANKKDKGWKKAVSEELKFLDENQDRSDIKLRSLEEELKSQLATQKRREEEIKNTLKLLEETFNRKLEESKKEWTVERDLLQARVNSLEEENTNLKVDLQNTNDSLMGFKERVQGNMKELEKHSEEEINKLRDTAINHTAVDPSKKIKIVIPKYKGLEYERPIKFLTELRKYINVTNPNFDELLYIISQALEDTAKEWWYLIENTINSYDEFETQFKTRYWNKLKQKSISRKIEFGKFEENGKRTRVNYAIYLLGLATDLNENYEESELILKIGDHFSQEVRQAIQGQPIKNKETLFRILTDFDTDIDKNMSKFSKVTASSTPNNNFNNYRRNYQANNINVIKKDQQKRSEVKRNMKIEENQVKKKPTWQDTKKQATKAYDDIGVSKIDLGEGACALSSKNFL